MPLKLSSPWAPALALATFQNIQLTVRKISDNYPQDNLLDIFYKPIQKSTGLSSGQYDFYINISAGCAKFISVYTQPALWKLFDTLKK